MKADLKLLETRLFSVDSAKFAAHPVIYISDASKNEEPKLNIRLIHYPKLNKAQVCLAVSGRFHEERLCYYALPFPAWKERMWIYIDVETMRKILKELTVMLP